MKMFEHISSFWKKLRVIQKICFLVIFIAVIAGITAIVLLQPSSKVSAFNTPIRDAAFPERIAMRITDHIKALNDVDNANVIIVVSASVIITPKPGSDIATNRKKIEGIQKLIKLGVDGLKDENIVISDQNGSILNNFETNAE
jgi:flagellar biosynthesis/type III secretory pathway M-ring protein FliF/YscJ